ncbi:cytochrome C [Cupriavidus pinatubonensis]|nr:cytochrome C [Cupriavidus pinatubonensis]
MLVVCSGVAASTAIAQSASASAATKPADDTVAYRHYTLACMGCHGPEGEGVPDIIPPLRKALGRFVQTPAGRDFIVRVPGASNSALSDSELAAVTNMMLRRFNSETAPPGLKPYTAEEVAQHRRPVLSDVQTVRAAVMESLRRAGVQTEDGY